MNPALLEFQQFNVLVVLAGAQNQSQRFGLAWLALVSLQPVQVKFHLPFVAGLEIADLQIQRHEAAELSMVKQQVEVVIPAVNLHPLLALHETETHAELQNKRLHLAQDGRFDVLLRVGVLQPKEIEQIRIAEHQGGGQLVLLAQLLQFHLGQFGGFPRQRRALEQHGLHFLVQGARIPSFDTAHLRVEIPLQWIVQVNDPAQVRPTQCSTQHADDGGIGKHLRKSRHVK